MLCREGVLRYCATNKQCPPCMNSFLAEVSDVNTLIENPSSHFQADCFRHSASSLLRSRATTLRRRNKEEPRHRTICIQ